MNPQAMEELSEKMFVGFIEDTYEVGAEKVFRAMRKIYGAGISNSVQGILGKCVLEVKYPNQQPKIPNKRGKKAAS